jgi:hypothetical protein
MVEIPFVRPEFRSFLQTDYFNLLLLLVSHLSFDLSTSRFVLCPHLHLSFAFLPASLLGQLANLLALPSIAYTNIKHFISSQHIHQKPMFIGLAFH